MLKNKLLSAMGGAPANYIEDVFSTYLYTGTGNSVTQRIASGIDLATKGGMVWVKNRTEATDHQIYDTARGQRKYIRSNTTDAEFDSGANQVQYKTSGWDAFEYTNELNKVMASWTFRKQPKFFDVVTWTGDDAADRQISHSLGSTPGCIIVKRTDASATWRVWHQNMVSNPANLYQYQLNLNTTNAVSLTYGEVWGTSNNVTSTTFQVGSLAAVNASGGTYVAYVFAHNAGGFGLTGTDNVISCGSFDATSAGSVELGYEPQWVLIKASNDVGSWHLQDNMRGYTTSGNNPTLDPDRSVAEFSGGYTNPTATGFKYGGMGSSFIYIAIRRGPMKVPTSGTSVFSPVAYNGTGTTVIQTLSTNFPVDLYLTRSRSTVTNMQAGSRLIGKEKYLLTDLTAAEQGLGGGNGVNNDVGFASNTGIGVVGDWNNPSSPNYSPYILEAFRRAPSFFDVVCYTGTGNNPLVLNHNLGVAPTIIIIKRRSSAASNNNWYCGWNMNASTYMEAILNTSDAGTLYNYPNWFVSAPTSTTFDLNGGGNVNQNGATYVAYLFATCAGVSKVGSYTGTGATQTIACGFTGGARFVLVKRTDTTGDWYVWDTARGMVSGTDPSLLLNSTAAEVNANSIYTTTGGFQIVSTAAGINASGGTYIYLAIA